MEQDQKTSSALDQAASEVWGYLKLGANAASCATAKLPLIIGTLSTLLVVSSFFSDLDQSEKEKIISDGEAIYQAYQKEKSDLIDKNLVISSEDLLDVVIIESTSLHSKYSATDGLRWLQIKKDIANLSSDEKENTLLNLEKIDPKWAEVKAMHRESQAQAGHGPELIDRPAKKEKEKFQVSWNNDSNSNQPTEKYSFASRIKEAISNSPSAKSTERQI